MLALNSTPAYIRQELHDLDHSKQNTSKCISDFIQSTGPHGSLGLSALEPERIQRTSFYIPKPPSKVFRETVMFKEPCSRRKAVGEETFDGPFVSVRQVDGGRIEFAWAER